MKRTTIIFLAGLTILIFTACGGGSSSSSSNNPQIKFIDSAYWHLTYSIDRVYTYDSDGNRLTQTETVGRIFDNGNFTPRFQSSIVANDTIKSTYIYDFDKNEVTMDSDAKYEGLKIFKFDDTGKILSSSTEVSDTKYVYSGNGVIQSITTNFDYMDFNSTSIYEYNEYGKISTSSENFDYSEANLPIGGVPLNYFGDSETIYTYNGGNNISTQEIVIKYDKYNLIGVTENYFYIYDSEVDGRVDAVYIDSSIEGTQYELHYQYYNVGTMSQYSYREDKVDGSWHECIYSFSESGDRIEENCNSGS